MFADFENMIKDKINSLKDSSPTDITRVPQKYLIRGKQIQQLKLLSEGSFGFIWLAEDLNTKQKYALKRIVCVTNERLLLAKNQLELMTTFPKAKNLVTCYGGELITLKNGNIDNKVMVILMEYCPNGTLFDLLQSRQNKGFTQKQLLQITYSILQGLKNIHQIGVYHQDVKIQNVLIGQDNTYKLCDFGSCSKRVINFAQIHKSEYNNIKEEIQAVTTPMYRPPEIVDPYLQYEVSHKVDVWMLGCVIYTLSYFTHPFVDSNAIGIANGIYRFPKYPEQTPYKVSDKIKDLIRNLLTPNPTFRPNVQQLMQIINNWHTTNQIPLNKQAQKRKEEQIVKEKELEKLNRKVVDFDGDIPADRLFELQKRLKNKDNQLQTKGASFITSKDVKKIKEGKPHIPTQVHNTPSNHQPTPPPTIKKPQQNNNVDMNSFWNPTSVSTTNNNPTQDKFDAFSNFFPTNTTVTKKQSNTTTSDMYDYFFTGEPTKPEPSKLPSKTKEVNLLDL